MRKEEVFLQWMVESLARAILGNRILETENQSIACLHPERTVEHHPERTEEHHPERTEEHLLNC